MTRYDDGAATAELAILLPSVVFFLVLTLSVIGAQLSEAKMSSGLASLVRALEAGSSPSELRELSGSLKIPFRQSEAGGLTCLTAGKDFQILGLNLNHFEQTTCGLAPGK